MKVADIMTRDVASCRPETNVVEVARIMCDRDCGAIPVLDEDGEPIGIVTDRDITCRAVAEAASVMNLTARAIMSRPVVTVSPESTVEECCGILESRQLRRVLVVDEMGSCCGIVAQADIARHAPTRDAAEVVRAVSTSKRAVDAAV